MTRGLQSWGQPQGGNVHAFGQKDGAGTQKARRLGRASSLALSGSNQARKGRLVDALAARGDEGRDTLR